MNTIYLKTKKGQKEIKKFPKGEMEEAKNFGWKLAYKNRQNSYFIITETEKCLNFNLQTIL